MSEPFPFDCLRMTRRRLLGTLTSAVGVSLLAACSSAPPTPAAAPTTPPAAAPTAAAAAQPTTPPAATQAPAATTAPAAATEKAKISFAWPFAYNQDLIVQQIKDFNDQSKTTQVELQTVPQDQVLPKMTALFTGGTPPDVFAFTTGWVTQFAAAGWLDGLDDRAKSSGLDKQILPAAMALGSYKNKLYLLPYLFSLFPMYHNTALFSDAGITAPPATYDEFRDTAKKLTDASKNRYGYYLLGASPWSFQQGTMWMFGYGGMAAQNTWFDDNGKCVLGRPGAVDGLKQWTSLYTDDKVSPQASATGGFQDASNAFNAGQIGLTLGWLPMITWARQGLGAGKFAVDEPPKGPQGQFVWYGIDGFCMSAQSKNKDAGWEFLQYLLKPEVNAVTAEQSGAIPVISGALNAKYLQDPVYKAPTDLAKREQVFIHPPDYLPEYASWNINTWPQEIQKVLLGQQTPQQAVDNLVPPLEQAYAKFKAG